jgi:hypothetical protein
MTITYNVPVKKQILDTLWEAFNKYLSIPIRIEPNSAGNIPTGTYASINIISGPTPVERDEVRQVNEGDDLKTSSVGQRELTVSVNIFGENSGEKSAQLAALVMLPEIMDEINFKHINLYGQELKVIESLGSQEVPNIIQSDYELRYQLDILLRTVSEVSSTTGTIAAVEGTGETTKSNQDVEDVDFKAP